MSDSLQIADQSFASRLFLGTGGYPNQQAMLDAHAASGTEMVTVSIRRISLEGYAESMVDLLGGRTRLLPNTAGCVTRRDAVLTAQLAREALGTDWIKLELIGDRETLYPDVDQLVPAAEELVADGFTVLPYCTDDPVVCQKLIDVGCAGEHRGDQGAELAARQRSTDAAIEAHGRVDQRLDTEPLDQRRRQQQPCIGNEVVVVEGRVNPVEGLR